MNRQVRSVTKRLWGVFLAVLLPTLSPAQPGAVPTRMSDAEATQQAKALLHRMTLAEKIGQMEQTAGQPMYTPPAEADRLASSGESGNFLFFTDPVRINELQKLAVTKTRLHIPLTFGYDVIHGFRTIAPIPLAMAASWDPALVTRTAAMAAREARAAGITLAFGPMVDIARDARWGRIMEGAGEDGHPDRSRRPKTVIGADCYIADRSMIMTGVHIGNGVVIGSNAIVTKDVPDYAIVGGVPAKVIGYRHDEERRRELLEIAWWEWPEAEVRAAADYLGSDDVDGFIAYAHERYPDGYPRRAPGER